MIRLKISEGLKLVIVMMITLSALSLWSFQLVAEKFWDVVQLAACLILITIVVFNTKVFIKKGLEFKTIVLLFLFLPLLSVIGAYIYHDQPINLSLLLLRTNLFWLLYFVLHIFDLPPKKIIGVLVFAGGVWAFLTIVQQFTYPHAYFFTRGVESKSGMRGNLIRFMPVGQQFGAFVLIYFFFRYLTVKDFKALLYVGLALIGLFYYSSRQILASGVACMLITMLYLKGVSKWVYLVLFSLIAILIVAVAQPEILVKYIDLTSQQVGDDDYVRYKEIDFYLNEYWPHWGAKFLGNGRPHLSSNYGIEAEYITTVLGYWRSDVGVIGAYNTYGIFYALTILWVSLKGIFMRVPLQKDTYLKIFFYYPTIMVLLDVGYSSTSGMCFFCLVFYLADKALQPKLENSIVIDQTVHNMKLTNSLV